MSSNKQKIVKNHLQLGKKSLNLMKKNEKKPDAKNLLAYRKDEVIINILSMKKPPKSIRTEEVKLKSIVKEKTSFSKGNWSRKIKQ